MFARIGRLVVHHPWRVIAAWVIAAIAIIAFAPKLTSTSNEASFLPSHYESIQAQSLQQSAFPHDAAPAAIIVLERADGTRLTATDTAEVSKIATRLSAEHVQDVTALQVAPPSPNKLIQTIAVQMPTSNNPQDTPQTNAVKALRTDLQSQLDGTALKAGITGTAASTLDSQSSGNSASKIIAVATVGLIIVLLLIIFRSPIIALLPILTIGVISQMADGLISWVSEAFNLQISSSVTALLIVVLFGIGTDYILFLMFRYRERLRAGEDSKTAMISAITRAGQAIASAAGAVIIAFLALVLSTLGLFQSLGPALAIAVFVTMLAGLTLIPAIVTLLGTRVFWPSKAWRKEPAGARYAAIGAAMGRHPARFAAASGLLMVVLGIAAFGFHPDFDLGTGSSATSQSSVWSSQLLKGEPAGATDPTDVYLRSGSGTRLQASELAAYRAKLAAVPGVGQVSTPMLSPKGNVAAFSVTLADQPASGAAISTVKGPLHDAAHHDAPAGTAALVGGTTAVYADIQSAVNHDYGVIFPVAAILIMIILGLVLRSAVAPWYLMVSVGLGFAATLGSTVLVFEHIQADSGLTFILPVIMYMFVVALGTDYNILMITRLREEMREGASPRAAAARAVQHAGPTIGAAGLILAGSFASLMLAGESTLSQMGFAISVGIAVAAFVMAMFFTPAITALIGRAAWWPGSTPSSSVAPGTRSERGGVVVGADADPAGVPGDDPADPAVPAPR
jgi:putative drug exporter of the RND superfamily